MTPEQEITYQRAVNEFARKVFDIRNSHELEVLKENIGEAIYQILGVTDTTVFDELCIDLVLFLDARIRAEQFFDHAKDYMGNGIYHPVQKN